jgi:hypothetical protein
MKTSLMRVVALCAVVLTSLTRAPFAVAQLATGTSDQFASYFGAGFDTVNLSNLNVHFAIPIVNKSGKRLGFYYNLEYDGLIWQPVTSGSTTSWTPVKTLGGNTNWGWTIDTDAVSGIIFEASQGGECGY